MSEPFRLMRGNGSSNCAWWWCQASFLYVAASLKRDFVIPKRSSMSGLHVVARNYPRWLSNQNTLD